MKVTIELTPWLEEAVRAHRPHASNHDCSWCLIRDGIGYVAAEVFVPQNFVVTPGQIKTLKKTKKKSR